MSLKTFCKYVFISGAILIIIIKLLIRPYFHFIAPLQFFFGIAPNLISAFLFPFVCYWLLGRWINLHQDRQFKLFCISCFAFLLINELFQLMPVFGRTFDYNDILASAVGLSASYFFCSKYLFPKMVPQQDVV